MDVSLGGPSEGKLQAGDHIIKINGEDVSRAPREHVIERVKWVFFVVVYETEQQLSNKLLFFYLCHKSTKLEDNRTKMRGIPFVAMIMTYT